MGSVGWDGGTWAWVGPTQDNPLQKGDSHKCMDSEKSNKTDAPDAATLSLGEESRLDNETTRISGQTDGNNTWDRQARELWQKHT